MAGINPYLMFNGNCEEAMNFYKDCFDGEILSMMNYENAPVEVDEAHKKNIMHSSLKFGDTILMASDTAPGNAAKFGDNVWLSINTNDLVQTEQIFSKLSEGGSVTMPLQDTFWGARFGTIKDKFSVNWMINCENKK